MGSYGIGVSRAVAALAEQTADEQGPVLAPGDRPGRRPRRRRRQGPPDRAGPRRLREAGRGRCRASWSTTAPASRPGVKFTDAELIGVPKILVAGRRSAEGVLELKDRRTGEREELTVDEADRPPDGRPDRPTGAPPLPTAPAAPRPVQRAPSGATAGQRLREGRPVPAARPTGAGPALQPARELQSSSSAVLRAAPPPAPARPTPPPGTASSRAAAPGPPPATRRASSPAAGSSPPADGDAIRSSTRSRTSRARSYARSPTTGSGPTASHGRPLRRPAPCSAGSCRAATRVSGGATSSSSRAASAAVDERRHLGIRAGARPHRLGLPPGPRRRPSRSASSRRAAPPTAAAPSPPPPAAPSPRAASAATPPVQPLQQQRALAGGAGGRLQQLAPRPSPVPVRQRRPLAAPARRPARRELQHGGRTVGPPHQHDEAAAPARRLHPLHGQPRVDPRPVERRGQPRQPVVTVRCRLAERPHQTLRRFETHT